MLIVFEGLDGSGKTSLIQLTKERLQQRLDIEVHTTSELGRSELCSVGARKAVMAARNQQEQLHYVIDARLTHYENVLQRLLSDDQVVLMDRYLLSTMAYQGCATISYGWLLGRHNALGLPRPALTFYLDLPVDTALQRLEHRPDPSRFDSRPREFFEEAHRRFEEGVVCCMDAGWNVSVLNAELPLAELSNRVIDLIIEHMADVAA